MTKKKFDRMPDAKLGDIVAIMHSDGSVEAYIKRGHETYSWLQLETTASAVIFPEHGDRRPVLSVMVRPALIIGMVDEDGSVEE